MSELTHTAHSSQFGRFLPMYDRHSIMASWIDLLFENLNSLDISIANFQVRFCWTFFPSELPLPPWVNSICRIYIYYLSNQISQVHVPFVDAFSLKSKKIQRPQLLNVKMTNCTQRNVLSGPKSTAMVEDMRTLWNATAGKPAAIVLRAL